MWLKLFKFISITIIFFYGCSNNPQSEKLVNIPKEKLSLNKIYSLALDDFNSGKATEAISKFKVVEKDYSYTDWGPKAVLMIAYIYYETGACNLSLSTLEKFFKSYPNDANTIYAKYLKGLCYYSEISTYDKDQTKTKEAIKYFNNLIGEYPNTEYATDAQYKIEALRDNLAAKELYLARFYMDREKWNTALGKLQFIIENYQDTIFIEEALHRKVEIYHKLGLAEEAKITAAILGYNYNNSDWYKKSYKLVGDKNFGDNKKKSTVLDSFKKVFN